MIIKIGIDLLFALAVGRSFQRLTLKSLPAAGWQQTQFLLSSWRIHLEVILGDGLDREDYTVVWEDDDFKSAVLKLFFVLPRT